MGNQFRWQATNASRAQGDWERDFLDEPIGHGNGKTTSILVSLYYTMWVPIASCMNQQWECAKRDGCTMDPYPLHQKKKKKKKNWALLGACGSFSLATCVEISILSPFLTWANNTPS